MDYGLLLSDIYEIYNLQSEIVKYNELDNFLKFLETKKKQRYGFFSY